MAILTSWYSLDDAPGVDFNNASQVVVSTVPEYPGGAGYNTPNLGDIHQGTNGSVWVLCQASTTISQYNAVVFDQLYKANNATSTLVADGSKQVGLAQFRTASVDPAANPVFWVAIKGTGFAVNVSGSTPTVSPATLCYTSNTLPGWIVATVTGCAYYGMSVVVSATNSALTEVILNYPRRSVGG